MAEATEAKHKIAEIMWSETDKISHISHELLVPEEHTWTYLVNSLWSFYSTEEENTTEGRYGVPYDLLCRGIPL